MTKERTVERGPHAELHYGYIDALRGCAILGVIATHVGQNFAGMPWAVSLIPKFGQMGVQLFFVVSAFTLCMSYEARAGEARALVSFFLRRLFRIYPMYLFGILIYSLFGNSRFLVHAGAESDFVDIGVNLFLVHGLVPSANNSVVPGGWSVGVEFLFYVAFPAFFRLFKRVERWGWCGLLGTLCVVVLLSMMASLILCELRGVSATNNSFEYYFITTQIPVFSIGMLTYMAENQRAGPFGRWPNWVQWFLVPLFACISGALLLSGVHLGGVCGSIMVLLSPFVAGLSFAALFGAFRCISVSFPLVEEIGKASFSMYILHFLIIDGIDGIAFIREIEEIFGVGLAFLVEFVLVLAASFALARMTYTYIEQPAIHLGRRIIRKIQT